MAGEHSRRQQTGHEHIDRNVSEIIALMQERKAAEATRTLHSLGVTASAGAPDVPRLLQTPDEERQGVYWQGRLKLLPTEGTFELRQEPKPAAFHHLLLFIQHLSRPCHPSKTDDSDV